MRPRPPDKMLILAKGRRRARKLKKHREKDSESRNKSQIMTATQSQTGKGMLGEEKGSMSDWRKECSEERREIVFEETSGFG